VTSWLRFISKELRGGLSFTAQAWQQESTVTEPSQSRPGKISGRFQWHNGWLASKPLEAELLSAQRDERSRARKDAAERSHTSYDSLLIGKWCDELLCGFMFALLVNDAYINPTEKPPYMVLLSICMNRFTFTLPSNYVQFKAHTHIHLRPNLRWGWGKANSVSRYFSWALSETNYKSEQGTLSTNTNDLKSLRAVRADFQFITNLQLFTETHFNTSLLAVRVNCIFYPLDLSNKFLSNWKSMTLDWSDTQDMSEMLMRRTGNQWKAFLPTWNSATGFCVHLLCGIN